MLIAFILVLLMIWAGILLSMYSIFIPFFHNIGDITAYNTAYYGAISASERWLLITKYQNPWFIWSGWRDDNIDYEWPASDEKNWVLWRLENANNSVWRYINSRTTQIPSTGSSNIPYFMTSPDSSSYNKLWYKQIERFLLSIDNTTEVNTFYDYDWTDNEQIYFKWSYINWTLRLPPKLYNSFGWNDDALLCDQEWRSNNCDKNQDTLTDETIVLRSLLGKYDSPVTDFTLLPTTKILRYKTPAIVDSSHDNNIRESDINSIQASSWILIELTSTSDYDPITTHLIPLLTKHNIISTIDDIIQNKSFGQIYQESSNLELQLSLASLLETRNNNIYPFLEYQITTDDPIADKYYNIQASSRVWQYNVKINIKKPTTESDSIWTFTIIF